MFLLKNCQGSRFLLLTVFSILIISIVSAQSKGEKRRKCGGVFTVREGRTADGRVESRRYKVPPYECPADTLCCSPARFNCCLSQSNQSFLSVFWHKIVLVLGLILAVTLVMSLLIVCVWNERCPMHKLVRKRAKPDYIANAEETAGLTKTAMPEEKVGNTRVYQVNTDVIYRQDTDLS